MSAAVTPRVPPPHPRPRALLAFMLWRFRRSTGARVGRVFALAITAGFATVAFVLRASDGEAASLSGLVARAAGWLCWLAAGPVALAAANARTLADRAEGVEALARSRGASERAIEAARAVAAMIQVALVVGVPTLALGAVVTALSGSPQVALSRALATLGTLVFALAAGVSLGGVARLSDRIARDRGRSLLLFLVFVPWVVADATSHPGLSIPGALGALLASVQDSVAWVAGGRLL